MNLKDIKDDIDKIVHNYKDKWMNFVFEDDPETAVAFKEKQIYKAMYIMSKINAYYSFIKNPIVTTRQEGFDFIFTWEFKKSNRVKLELVIPWEGNMLYMAHFIHGMDRSENEYFDKSFSSIGQEISDIGVMLKEATIEETINGSK